MLRTPLGVETIEAADLYLASPNGRDAPGGDRRMQG
jgi:hypothetical protein